MAGLSGSAPSTTHWRSCITVTAKPKTDANVKIISKEERENATILNNLLRKKRNLRVSAHNRRSDVAQNPYAALSHIDGITQVCVLSIQPGTNLESNYDDPLYSYSRDVDGDGDVDTSVGKLEPTILSSLVQFGITHILHASDLLVSSSQKTPPPPSPPPLSFPLPPLLFHLLESTPKSLTLLSTNRRMLYIHYATSLNIVVVCVSEGNPKVPNVVRGEVEGVIRGLGLD